MKAVNCKNLGIALVNAVHIDCPTVEDFIYKYYKSDRLLVSFRGEGYEKIIIEGAKKELKAFGYTVITKYESKTGEAVYFVDSNKD